jgi:hypothetical protein
LKKIKEDFSFVDASIFLNPQSLMKNFCTDREQFCIGGYTIVLLTPFWSAKHSTRTVAVPSAQGQTVRSLVRGAAVLSAKGRTVRAQGPDGPRPGAGRSVRVQGRRKIAGGAWISLPGGTPSGRRDPRSCLGSGRPT